MLAFIGNWRPEREAVLWRIVRGTSVDVKIWEARVGKASLAPALRRRAVGGEDGGGV